MSVFQPFAFIAGQAVAPPGGFDPTLGGTVNPEYWWDLQDAAYLTLSGTNVDGATNRGSQGVSGDLAMTYSAVQPAYITDVLGKPSVQFYSSARLGNPATLIPHGTNCTVFIAFNPDNSGGSSQCVFGHEGYTYSGNFAQIQRGTINKGTSTAQEWWFNGVNYPYGVGYTTTAPSLDTMTRPVLSNSTRLWIRAGNENFSSMFNNMTTLIATREWSGDSVTVQNAINTATMGNTAISLMSTSTAPDEGTAIGQAGRASLNRDPYYGGVYQVVVYLQKLSQAQITELYNGWIAGF